MSIFNQICFREQDFKQLTDYLYQTVELETGAMAFYRVSATEKRTKLLVREVLIPRDEDYLVRTATQIAFTSEFVERCHQICEVTSTNLLDIHTHPWSKRPRFSLIDDREATETKIPYLTQWLPQVRIAFLLFGNDPGVVRGRFWDGKRASLQAVDQLRIM